MSFFDEIHDRTFSLSRKWGKCANQDIIPMWVADMDFRTAPQIVEALLERVQHGIFGYAEVPEELTELALEYLAQRHGWQARPEWLEWIPGVVPGFNMAARVFAAPGQGIVIPTPAYYNLLQVPQNSGQQAVPVKLVRDGNSWVMDFDAIEQALASRDPSPSMLLLCNPQNPTGRAYTRSELETLIRLLERYQVSLCSDEVHCDLVLDRNRKHLPIASLSEVLAERSITLMAPTKTFNISGLTCAFAIIPNRDLRHAFHAARIGMIARLSPLALYAAMAGYRSGWEWHKELIAYLKGNADRVLSCVEGLSGIRTTPVEATCLSWLDIRELGLEDPAAHFESHGIKFSPGAQFGGGPGFLRLNFGCPRATLDAGLDRLAAGVAAARDAKAPPARTADNPARTANDPARTVNKKVR